MHEKVNHYSRIQHNCRHQVAVLNVAATVDTELKE